MAVYCSVCTNRLSSACDNGGSFRVTSEFKGWSERINDTCESCAQKLSEAVTKAAMRIIAKNQSKVDRLRIDIEIERAGHERLKKERAEFEQEWAKRKAGTK